MRRNLQVKNIESLYNSLILNTTVRVANQRKYYTIENFDKINLILSKLNEYNFIGDSIEKIYSLSPAYQNSIASFITLELDDYTELSKNIDLVRAKCEAMIDCDINKDEINNLYVKLPDNLKDLEKLSGIIKDLNFSINKCPILHDEIGEVSFKRVEEGSNWIVLSILFTTSIPAVAKSLDLIANFIKKCYEIKLLSQELKSSKIDNVLKLMELEEKQIKEYEKKIKNNIDKKIDEECLIKFKEITDKKITPENETKIKYSMKLMIDLLKEGVEIYPSQQVDEKIKLLFPKQEEIKKIDLEPKKINLKNNNENN